MAKLSIVISTYNRVQNLRKYIAENLKVIDQFNEISRGLIKLVVWDNASSDESEQYCESISHPLFEYYRNPSNVGILGNPIEAANGLSSDYIWLIGDDDIIINTGLNWIWHCIESERPDLIYINCAPKKVGHFFSYKPPTFNRSNSKIYTVPEIVTCNKLFFTAHYSLCMSIGLARKVFGYYNKLPYFTDLNSTIPTTGYLLNNYATLRCMTNVQPSVIAYQDVSWSKHVLKWNLVILPEVLETISRINVSQKELHYWKKEHLAAVYRDLYNLFLSNKTPDSFGISRKDLNRLPEIFFDQLYKIDKGNILVKAINNLVSL